MNFILNVTEINDSNKESVVQLYRTSFPHRERDSIHKFLYHDGSKGKIHVFYNEIGFVGFVCLLRYKTIINILYLAVAKEFQGRGYGHEILERIKRMYPNHIFIADIEKDEESCVNHDMRKKREMFYLHDDYKESEITYNYKGVDYVIMVANGTIKKEDFINFWKEFSHVDDLGRYIVKNYK